MKPTYNFPKHVIHPKDTFFNDAKVAAYQSKFQAVLDTGVEKHRFLEIGVRLGYSAICLLQAAPESEYLGLDGMLDEENPKWALGVNTLETAERTLKQLFPQACIKTKQVNTQRPEAYVLAGEPKGYTFVHVDGDHSFEGSLNDLEFALQASAQGATILVDDCYYEQVRDAVEQFVRLHRDRVRIARTYEGHNGEVALQVFPFVEVSGRNHSSITFFPGVGVCTEIHPSALLYYRAHNCAMVRINEKLIMAYRNRGRISAVELSTDPDRLFDPLPNTNVEITLPLQSGTPFPRLDAPKGVNYYEDPRLLWVGKRLMLSVIVTPPDYSQTRQGVVELNPTTLQPVGPVNFPAIGNNHKQAYEKNWTFFDNGGTLGCFYKLNPPELYHNTLNPREKQEHLEKRSWKYGFVSGGTPLVDYSETELLGLFHSFNTSPRIRDYYAGFFVVEKTTLRVKALAKHPIMKGEKITTKDTRPEGWTPNAVFPCGLVEIDGVFAVSLGWQDCRCLIKTFTRQEIEENLNRDEVPKRAQRKLLPHFTSKSVWLNFPETKVTLGKHTITATSFHTLVQLAKPLGFSEAEVEEALIKALDTKHSKPVWAD